MARVSAVAFVGSSERWEVRKPDAGFFRHVVEEAGVRPEEIAYIGDRVDNDALSALAELPAVLA